MKQLLSIAALLGCLCVPSGEGARAQTEGAVDAAQESADGDGVRERGVRDRIKQRLEKRKLNKEAGKIEGRIERAELELQMRQMRLQKVRDQSTIRVVGPDTVQVGDRVFRGRRAVRRAQRAARRPRKELGKLEREVEDYTAQLDGPLDYAAEGGPRRAAAVCAPSSSGWQERLEGLSGGPPAVRPSRIRSDGRGPPPGHHRRPAARAPDAPGATAVLTDRGGIAPGHGELT